MAPQGSSPDGFSREVQLFCVALGRVVAVSDLCLPVIPKRRSGQLAPSNNNPERSNDPLSASWELSRSPSGKTRGPSRHDQFARTKQIGTTLPLCNRRPFGVAHSHKEMRDGPLAQPVDALHTHDVIARLLENMRGGGESVLR